MIVRILSRRSSCGAFRASCIFVCVSSNAALTLGFCASVSFKPSSSCLKRSSADIIPRFPPFPSLLSCAIAAVPQASNTPNAIVATNINLFVLIISSVFWFGLYIESGQIFIWPTYYRLHYYQTLVDCLGYTHSVSPCFLRTYAVRLHGQHDVHCRSFANSRPDFDLAVMRLNDPRHN